MLKNVSNAGNPPAAAVLFGHLGGGSPMLASSSRLELGYLLRDDGALLLASDHHLQMKDTTGSGNMKNMRGGGQGYSKSRMP